MKDFKDKVVVITGGATGIGKAMADRFGAAGAKVVISARRENRLQEAVEDLRSKGVDARYKTCDVADQEQVQALADFAFNEFGQVDVLVNNAGITGPAGLVVDQTRENYLNVLNVNVFGMLNGIWAFGKRMIEQGTEAMIINVGSEVGLYPIGPTMSTYSSSKYMQRALTIALSMEMPEYIEVCGVYPGLVQSELGGSTAQTQAGMSADAYMDIIWPQIENGELYVVSHPWGRDYYNQHANLVTGSFDKYAPHYEGDDEYDTISIARKMFEQQQ